MIRDGVRELMQLGAFPASQNVVPAVISKQEKLLCSIVPPVSDDEARELVKLFGPDEYYGGAWTVLHMVETAPHWPLMECLGNSSNQWIALLKERILRKDRSTIDKP